MSDAEPLKEEIKPRHLFLVAIIVAIFVGIVAFAIHDGFRLDARQKEIDSVHKDSERYDRERLDYLHELVNQMSDCQRLESAEYAKKNCAKRAADSSEQRDRLERYRIELNYRIEKLWPEKP